MSRHPRNKEVQFLKGIGPQRAEALERIGIRTVEDMLFHFPRDYQDRSNRKPIHQLRDGEVATVAGAVMEVRERRPRRSHVRSVYEALLRDHTGDLILVWFNQPYLSQIILPGTYLLCRGKVKRYRQMLQMTAPDYERVDAEEGENTDPIWAVYPLTEGVTQGALRKCVRAALAEDLEGLPEMVPEEVRVHRRLLSRRQAVRCLHRPPVENLEKRVEEARRTIVFEEFFLLELALGLRRKMRRREVRARSLSEVVRPGLRERYVSGLPFELTRAQERVIQELGDDLEKPQAMERLLQGDVGCGKTVVILWALLWAVEHGLQGALMVPTEILAEQHLRTVRHLTDRLEVSVELLTGSTRDAPSTSPEPTLWGAAGNGAHIVIGTHALFYERARFDKLGVVVIDEQHKFGVLQRQKLLAKGEHPHLLITSATPIPRTLAMTVYGDLDVSVIDELPPGRPKIITRWTQWPKADKVYGFLSQHLRAGRQLYVICPLVEPSEKNPHLAAAEDRFPVYRDVIFPGIPCSLIHGRMSAAEKESVMCAFERGETQVLVSTTVIEVGIDVPNASLMLIENAERFGLSQLHQLRGRIGRGTQKSYCILMTGANLVEPAERRMQTMEKFTDGFQVAEEDLAIRGPGELMGTRQSGALPFRLANLIRDEPILIEAREEAQTILEKYPRLKGDEFTALREELRSQKYLTA